MFNMEKEKLEWIASDSGDIRDFLKDKLTRKFYKSLTNRNVRFFVNGVEHKNFEKYEVNDVITITFDKNIIKSEFSPVESDLKVYYETDNYMIVYKESPLLSIPTKSFPNSLFQQVLFYYKRNNINKTIHLINRLDKDTEGLVLIAKDRYSASILNNRKDSINRKYLAICKGHFKEKEGTISTYMEKDNLSLKRIVSNKGQKAITEYKVLEEYSDNRCLVEFHLLTGRTHQIRVHSSSLGAPIEGDMIYGDGTKDSVLKLTSYYISFIDPFTNKEEIVTIKPKWM